MSVKSIAELEGRLSNKVVITRVDFNIPVIEGKIADYTRINKSIATIKYLQSNGAKIVLLSHFGRPEGKTDPALSLSFLLPELTNILQTDIKFSYQHAGLEPKKIIESMKPGGVLLLENIRFDQRELLDDEKFAGELASVGDCYVNEAFSASHRAHASISSITSFLPSYAGFAFLDEVTNLQKINNTQEGKKLAIIGGKKISTKINILENLISKMDRVAVGGAMANTFLKARGVEIGESFYEKECLAKAEAIMNDAKSEILLPDDFICLHDKELIIENTRNLSSKSKILDIGPISAFRICHAVSQSEIVVWNGPLGMIEDQRFAFATEEVAKFIASMTSAAHIKSILGGGDTVAAVNKFSLTEYFNYVSTAGGAFLEWLEGNESPGMKALKANRTNLDC